jgi:hypothetical protein
VLVEAVYGRKSNCTRDKPTAKGDAIMLGKKAHVEGMARPKRKCTPDWVLLPWNNCAVPEFSTSICHFSAASPRCKVLGAWMP